MFIAKDGWREAMSGTLSLYAEDGERLHTIYVGGAPEYGKDAFLKRMAHEIAHVTALYPAATRVGLADGAKCNWTFLAEHTQFQILDFWHVGVSRHVHESGVSHRRSGAPDVAGREPS